MVGFIHLGKANTFGSFQKFKKFKSRFLRSGAVPRVERHRHSVPGLLLLVLHPENKLVGYANITREGAFRRSVIFSHHQANLSSATATERKIKMRGLEELLSTRTSLLLDENAVESELEAKTLGELRSSKATVYGKKESGKGWGLGAILCMVHDAA